jgi:hypothetical protein
VGKVPHIAARKFACSVTLKSNEGHRKELLGHTFDSAKSARALPSPIFDSGRIRAAVEPRIGSCNHAMKTNKQLIYTLDFAEIGIKDISRVGGKNASLGELFNALKPQGVGVIDGFATTADAYRPLLAQGQLEYELRSLLSDFDLEDVEELRRRGHAARVAVLDMPLPKELRHAIISAYEQLCNRLGHEPQLAVRSSATAEDLPEASFAGAAETFLNW